MKGVCRFWTVLIVSLLPANLAWSVGLGDMTIRSSLDESLSAEINLLGIEPDALDTIHVRQAFADELQRFDVQVVPEASDIAFQSLVREDGSIVVTVSTVRPIAQNLVRLLIVLEWRGENVYREYIFGLIPAASEYGGLARVVAPIIPTVSAFEDYHPQGSAADTETSIEPGDSYGPIAPAENLITISKAIKTPEPISIYQKLFGLLARNTHAFIIGNMNLLRAGVVLDIPPTEELKAISRVLAMETYTRQVAEWHEYRLNFQMRSNAKTNQHQFDPALNLMKTTVEELRKEIERLRALLESSVAEQNRAVELKQEETEYRKQLEDDIKRLEASRIRLLTTISDIANPPESVTPSVSDNDEDTTSEKLTTQVQGATITSENGLSAGSQPRPVSQLQERISTMEERLESLTVRNQALKARVITMTKESEEARELLRTKDEAFKTVQQEAAVYAATLESLEVESEDFIFEPQIVSEPEERITTLEERLRSLSLENEELKAQVATLLGQRDKSAVGRSGLTGSPIVNQLNGYILIGIGLGIGFLVSLLTMRLNKLRTESIDLVVQGDDGASKGSQGKETSGGTKGFTAAGPRGAQNNISDHEENLELDTKLDLARAYIEMEDHASARQLLLEVEKQGNDFQKIESRRLLKTMGE